MSIFVARIPPIVSSQELRKIFEKFGQLTEFDVKRTFAFISYPDIKSAEKAIEEVNGKQIDGLELAVVDIERVIVLIKMINIIDLDMHYHHIAEEVDLIAEVEVQVEVEAETLSSSQITIFIFFKICINFFFTFKTLEEERRQKLKQKFIFI
ncbi:MAG: hypothetical protein EZS28_005595 [Streblomastix strix]|uniref:RRM domain-containing protein n=1 Tax=Streblomastix strix TaxID=222440 RepID=A0A5J4WWF9_9EUKA|nr:MAG: hypothetical protein EZS28_005595 [Streblomastix strix]